MDQQQAQQLAEQIRQEFQIIQTEVIHSGYPGYDEAWHVKISVTANGVTTSTELDDAEQWMQFKKGLSISREKS